MIQPDDIFKKIGFILNDLQDQHDYLTHHPEKINAAELQLFQANADFLSEHAKIYQVIFKEDTQPTRESNMLRQEQQALPTGDSDLKLEPEDLTVEEAEELEARVDISKGDIMELKDDPTSNFPAPKFDFGREDDTELFDYEQKPADALFDRTLSDEEQEILQNARSAVGQPVPYEEEASAVEEIEVAGNEEEAEPETEEEEGPEPFLLDEEPAAGTQFQKQEEEEVVSAPHQNIPAAANEEDSDRKLSIHELLASASGVRPAPLAPIRDLKQSISLNDKLLYIRDLFNGYNLAYSEAVDLVNKMQDFASADAFLQKNYAGKNNWAEKESTVERFYELLNRRFPSESK